MEYHNLCSQEINENMTRWLVAFSESTSDNICALYDKHASLWGTTSPIKRNSSTLIKNYFDQIFKYQDRYVELNDSDISFFGEIAIINGLYTFNWLKENVKVTILARFSFVYIKKDGDWFIVEHHSSAIPVAT